MPVPGGAAELTPRRPLRGLGARDPCAGRRRGGGRGHPSGTTAGLDMLVRAVAQAGGSADHSGAGCAWAQARPVARGATHTYPPCPAPAAGDAHGATDGNDRALRSACATGPEAHGGDRCDRLRHVGPPLLRRPRKDAAGDADRRPLPRHAALLEGDRRGDGGRRARDPRPTGVTPGADWACPTAEAMRDACGWATAEEAEPMPGGVSGGRRIRTPPRREVARTVRERGDLPITSTASPPKCLPRGGKIALGSPSRGLPRTLATWSTTTLRSSPG